MGAAISGEVYQPGEDSTAVATYGGMAIEAATSRQSLEAVIEGWLDEKQGRTGSARTRRAYADELHGFRRALQAVGLDLDSPPVAVSLVAQKWLHRDGVRGRIPTRAAASLPTPTPPAATTVNQRAACVSSFYAYWKRKGWAGGNPLDLVKRSPVQDYAAAQPLEAAVVRRKLGAIDRSTPAGLRDYALLAVALQTGRRLAEIAALQRGDVMKQDDGRLLLIWRRAKGGKVMRDILAPAASNALAAWMSYQLDGAVQADWPVWVSLASNRPAAAADAPPPALSKTAIAKICEERLGIGKVHALRHTFARQMEQAGAKVSEIQSRLGHSNLATTGRYLAALTSAENQHADTLAAALGIN